MFEREIPFIFIIIEKKKNHVGLICFLTDLSFNEEK